MKNRRIETQLLISLIIASALFLWSGVKSKRAPSLEKERASQTIVNPPAAMLRPDMPATSTMRRPARPAPAPASMTGQADPEHAPGWTVRFGGEFWRRPEHNAAGAAPDAGDGSVIHNAPFSVGDVIERVTHALEADPASGLPRLDAGNYVAQFDGEGLRFSPHRPGEAAPALAGADAEGIRQHGKPMTPPSTRSQADPATELRFRTVSIQRDGEMFFSSERGNSEWSVLGNTAQALLSAEWGLVEHYEASGDGVAVTWVLAQPLPGDGAVEVVAAVEGLSYAGLTQEGHHFADRDGVARVRVGRVSAVDALGNRWELALNPAPDESGKLFITLPGEVQRDAVYPLAIDPILSAEFGMDQPVSGAASGRQGNPAIARGAGMYLVVWEDDRHSSVTGRDIYGTRVSDAGLILDPLGIAICATYDSQNNPSVAAFGTTFLVVWSDRRLGGDDIFGARVLSTGIVSDPLGFAISIDLAQNAKSVPVVAGGPPGFMVVWEDDRNAVANGTDIYGARVNTAGVVLDPTGVAISTDGSDQFNPTVVTNSNGFFVAWQDDRNSGVTGTDIYGARVSSAGVLLDPVGVALSTAASNQTEPASAANGGRVLVTWRDRRTSGTTSDDIFGTRVTFLGNIVNVLDPLGFGISTNSASQRTPAAAANGSGFLVVWRDRRNLGTTGDDIYGARIDTNGIVQEPTGFVICTNSGNQTVPAVASSSSGALVVWTDPRNSANTDNDIFGARVTTAGVLQETNGVAVSRSGAAQSSPAVAFNGTNYLVVWQDERNFTTNSTDILGTRVTAAGAIADVAGIKICTLTTAQRNPSVAASGGGFLVAWEDSRNFLATGIDIYGARVTGAGTVADPAGLALSTATGDQTLPSAAGNPNTFLVAWADERNGQPEIFGTRVSQAGTISNPGGLVISSTGVAETRPALGATSNGFLVVWENSGNNDILGARVTSAGVVSDPSGSPIQITSTGSGSFPVVAGHGTNYLVAWVDDRSSGDTGLDIYAARVAGNGMVPDFDGFPVCTSPTSQFNPAVAAGPNEYLLVWEDRGSGNQLYSARVSTNGAVLDMWGVPLAGSGDRITPAVAYGGANKYLLVSEAFRRNSQRTAAYVMSSDPPSTYPIIQFSTTSYSVAENGKFARITVTLKGRYSGVVTVDFATADGTAFAGTDYMPQAGRVVFANRKTSAVVMVPIIDDLVDEMNETVTLTLQSPVGGAWLGLRHTATLTILDNDP